MSVYIPGKEKGTDWHVSLRNDRFSPRRMTCPARPSPQAPRAPTAVGGYVEYSITTGEATGRITEDVRCFGGVLEPRFNLGGAGSCFAPGCREAFKVPLFPSFFLGGDAVFAQACEPFAAKIAVHDAAARSKLIVKGLDECLTAGLTQVQTNDDRTVTHAVLRPRCPVLVPVPVLHLLCHRSRVPVVGPRHAGQDVSAPCT